MVFGQEKIEDYDRPEFYRYQIRRKEIEEPPKKQEAQKKVQDSSIFQGKERLTRPELRERLRKTSPVILGTGGKMYSKQQRVALEKEVFTPGKYHKYGKYGYHYVTPQDFKGAIKGLEKERFREKEGVKRLEIDRRIRYLKQLGGV